MELKEVGMYAYSKSSRDYGIGKVVNILPNGFAKKQVEIQYPDAKVSFGYSDIEASHDITSLLKYGDYVNGSKVCFFKSDDNNKLWIYTDNNYKYGILEDEIEDIVTKEQFDSIKYKVGE